MTQRLEIHILPLFLYSICNSLTLNAILRKKNLGQLSPLNIRVRPTRVNSVNNVYAPYEDCSCQQQNAARVPCFGCIFNLNSNNNNMKKLKSDIIS